MTTEATPTFEAQAQALYVKAANNNPLALDFLQRFHIYAHEIDDYIDNGSRDPQELLRLLIHANQLYSTPFFALNASYLKGVIVAATADFADSLRMASDPVEWKRRWGDVLRFSGNAVVIAVASLTGGFGLAQDVGREARSLSWECHHAADGTPV